MALLATCTSCDCKIEDIIPQLPNRGSKLNRILCDGNTKSSLNIAVGKTKKMLCLRWPAPLDVWSEGRGRNVRGLLSWMLAIRKREGQKLSKTNILKVTPKQPLLDFDLIQEIGNTNCKYITNKQKIKTPLKTQYNTNTVIQKLL